MEWKELTQVALDMMDALQAQHLDEVELHNGDCSIRVKAAQQPVVAAPVPVAPAAQQAEPDAARSAVEEDTLPVGTRVEAPLVGVFYGAPSPEAPPFVLAGQKVQKGDTLFIIEAMKTMNEIKAPCDGTVERILVQPGDLVEYKQVLAILN